MPSDRLAALAVACLWLLILAGCLAFWVMVWKMIAVWIGTP